MVQEYRDRNPDFPHETTADQLFDEGQFVAYRALGEFIAETALKLGGKSDDEARRTGAIDKADDQVEQLFKPQYQTVNSPAHRAVWDRGLPVDLVEAARAGGPHR